MTSKYEIDPAHSNLQFSVRHLMISNVRGAFSGVQGVLTYDPVNPAASSVEVTVDVNSVNTHEAQRDGHLKSPDFFDAEKFPTIAFRSTKIDKKSASEFAVMGDLTIHGVTKPVTLDVTEVSPEANDPWGNLRFGASAKTKIKRGDFGLTWNAPLETGGFVVGDEVKLDFEVQFMKSKSAAA